MKKKSPLDEREIYKSIRKTMPPPTKSIPDKREELREEQFKKDLKANLKSSGKPLLHVKVRFAPSPTGFLHIGGARTALYNWLFAKNQGGTFVLRIEDTDRARSTQEAIEAILNSLTWLGLNWDEGPYHQMDRLDLYREKADWLLMERKAYRCYCLPAELEERRKSLTKGKVSVDECSCLGLSSAEAGNLEKEGRKPSIRFHALDEGQTVVSDSIRGEVVFENALLDDFIIVRSDGIPTYNFAAVIDDAEMGITHVIRGDDHLSNTPKQILVYETLGYPLPVFAHLPMILGKDKAPLSKRHGATAVEEFKEQGYLPEAILNYLALLGWSFDETTTLFSIDDLVEKFSLERVSRSAAVFDLEKLDWMNGFYIRSLSVSELTQKCLPFLKKAGFVKETDMLDAKETGRFEKMVSLVRERIKKLSEITRALEFFFAEELVLDETSVEKVLKKEGVLRVVETALKYLGGVDKWNQEEIEKILRAMQEELDLKPKAAFQPVRVATTGHMVSPPLFEALELLGKEEVLKRLGRSLQLIGQG